MLSQYDKFSKRIQQSIAKTLENFEQNQSIEYQILDQLHELQWSEETKFLDNLAEWNGYISFLDQIYDHFMEKQYNDIISDKQIKVNSINRLTLLEFKINVYKC